MITTVNSWTPKEIRATDPQIGAFTSIPVTVSGASVLDVGQVLAKLDDDTYGDDNTKKAVALLGERVDPTDGPVLTYAYVRGIFVEDQLTGLTDDAKTDLNARSLVNGWLVLA